MIKIAVSPRTLASAFVAVCLVAAAPLRAETFQSRPIELVVPVNPGGGTDVIGRAVAEAAQKYLSQPIVVLNRPGASGSIGLAEAARSKPDGHKISMLIPEVTYLVSLGIGKVSQDDFVPLAQFTSDPASITVRAEAPWNTVEEFLQYAKANPEAIRIANAGNGTSWHLAAAALEDKTGTKFIHVPYQGSAPAFLGLLSGQVEATTVAPGEMVSHIAAGKLKVLAVMSAKRIKGFENVPTLKEKGVDLVVNVFRGVGAPKDTPAPIVKELREVLKKASEDPDLRMRVEKQAMNFSYAGGEEFKVLMQRDADLFRPLVTRLKLNN